MTDSEITLKRRSNTTFVGFFFFLPLPLFKLSFKEHNSDNSLLPCELHLTESMSARHDLYKLCVGSTRDLTKLSSSWRLCWVCPWTQPPDSLCPALRDAVLYSSHPTFLSWTMELPGWKAVEFSLVSHWGCPYVEAGEEKRRLEKTISGETLLQLPERSVGAQLLFPGNKH